MKIFLRFEIKTVDPHINVRVYNEPKKAGDSAVHLLTVDCDELPDLVSQFGVMSMPTVIFFHQGQPVEKLIGLRPKDAYRNLIANYPSSTESA